MADARQDLLDILRESRVLLSQPGNDFSWSSWESSTAALVELDQRIAAIEAGQLPERLDLAVLYAATGPMQEVSVNSGWALEFLAIAARFDQVAQQVWNYE